VLCDAGTEMAYQEAVERSAAGAVAAVQRVGGRPVVMAVA